MKFIDNISIENIEFVEKIQIVVFSNLLAG